MENWKESFDEKFCGNNFGGLMPQHRDGGKILRKEVLTFIESLLTQQEARLKQELREKIKERKTGHAKLHGTIDCEPCAYADVLTFL